MIKSCFSKIQLKFRNKRKLLRKLQFYITIGLVCAVMLIAYYKVQQIECCGIEKTDTSDINDNLSVERTIADQIRRDYKVLQKRIELLENSVKDFATSKEPADYKNKLTRTPLPNNQWQNRGVLPVSERSDIDQSKTDSDELLSFKEGELFSNNCSIPPHVTAENDKKLANKPKIAKITFHSQQVDFYNTEQPLTHSIQKISVAKGVQDPCVVIFTFPNLAAVLQQSHNQFMDAKAVHPQRNDSKPLSMSPARTEEP